MPRWQVLSQVSDPTTLAQLDHMLDDVQQTVEAEHSVLLPARLCVAALRADARAMLLRALLLNRAAPMEVFKSTLLVGLAGTTQQPQHADDGVLRVEAALCDGVRRAAQQRLLQVMTHRVARHRAVNSSDEAAGPSSEVSSDDASALPRALAAMVRDRILDVPAGPEHDAAVSRFTSEPALTQAALLLLISLLIRMPRGVGDGAACAHVGGILRRGDVLARHRVQPAATWRAVAASSSADGTPARCARPATRRIARRRGARWSSLRPYARLVRHSYIAAQLAA